MTPNWYSISNAGEIPSPALLVYSSRVDENLSSMLAIAGTPDRLRPHIKTHKMPAMIQRQLGLGITRFKCATIAEAEMAAGAGARDILIAFQMVGPNVQRLIELTRKFPKTRFSTIADNQAVVEALSSHCLNAGTEIEVLVDIDCGMHRSGIPSGPAAHALYLQIAALPGLIPGGLHVYDGHIHDSDITARKAASNQVFSPPRALRDALLIEGAPVPRIVAGGSPTFPCHATREPFVECSPGTSVFWDGGYSQQFPDLKFKPAALVLTRVISKLSPNRLCLDLGHKAVAAENPLPKRVHFLNLPEATFISQSEEHLVITSEQAATFDIGDVLYGLPWHICPTVALHSKAVVIHLQQATDHWPVTARTRSISI